MLVEAGLESSATWAKPNAAHNAQNRMTRLLRFPTFRGAPRSALSPMALREVVENLQSFACELHGQLTPEQWSPLIDASQAALAKVPQSAPLASVTRSD